MFAAGLGYAPLLVYFARVIGLSKFLKQKKIPPDRRDPCKIWCMQQLVREHQPLHKPKALFPRHLNSL